MRVVQHRGEPLVASAREELLDRFREPSRFLHVSSRARHGTRGDGRRQRLGSSSPHAGAPRRERDHRLRHRAVAAGAAEIAERGAHDLAGAAHVADVAHGDVELAVDGARDHRPLRAFDLEEQVGELRDELRIPDGPEVREHHAVHELRARVRPIASVSSAASGSSGRSMRRSALWFASGWRNPNASTSARVVPRSRCQRVGLDAVEQRGGEALRDLRVGGAQVLGEDRRRRAVRRPDVLHGACTGGSSGWWSITSVDVAQALLEEARLHVDHAPRVVVVAGRAAAPRSPRSRGSGHGAVFGPRDSAERGERRAAARRPSTTRRASAEAMASGSGSSCIMITTRPARSNCARSR